MSIYFSSTLAIFMTVLGCPTAVPLGVSMLTRYGIRREPEPRALIPSQTNQFIAKLPYDIMAIGNHELYIYANTLDMYTNFAPKLNGRYLSSNVNITVFDKHNNSVSVPVGERFVKFKTEKGRKVTALGVLFDFTGNDVNTTVQKVEDMVKETWFAEAIKEAPDFFLLAGLAPVTYVRKTHQADMALQTYAGL
jgi:hypothetical protein